MPKGTKVYRCVQKLVKKGRSKASAIRICQSSTGQSYKTGKKSKRATVPLDESLVADSGDPGQIAEQKVAIEQMVLATKELTKAQQEVISLRFAGELSVAEVARVMGRSEGAVKALQHSAILALRKALVAG